MTKPLALTVLALALAAAPESPAQTFKVLHDFTGRDDGATPQSGLIMDRAGNLYGTTAYGGDTQDCSGAAGVDAIFPGCGVVYKMKKSGSGRTLLPLYIFDGKMTGYLSNYPGMPAIGPSGIVYGTTYLGGHPDYGNVFSLTPAPSAPVSVIAPWNYNLVYQFSSGTDSNQPSRLAPLLFDSAGDIYGAAVWGGLYNYGTVYELEPSSGGWTETILYTFTNGTDGSRPAGIIFGTDGSIYGTAKHGGSGTDCEFNYGCGDIFKLTPSSGGWTFSTLHIFKQGVDGGWPGPPIMDAAGNLYGLTTGFSPTGGGTIWELSPSGSGWNFSVLYNLSSQTVDDYGPYALTMDTAGNLYGISSWGGNNNNGYVFKLTRAGGGSWTYTDLHDFGSDACTPQGAPVLDTAGNIYGVAEFCGPADFGAVWEITP